MYDIEVYTKEDCIYCKKTKDLLSMLKLEYVLLLVDKDFDGATFKEKFWPSYPCVIVDGKIIGGYTEFANWCLDRGKFG